MLRLLIFLQILLICATEIKNKELVSLSVIFRHGDRTIEKNSYPNDPYKSRYYWPDGFAQLTNRGKLRHYVLGQWLKQRYSNFLSKLHPNDDVYVLSSDSDRTIISAECNMAGLFTPSANDSWNPILKWQPIPIHTIPKNFDNLISMQKPCPKFNNLLHLVKNSPPFSKMDEHNRDLYAYLSAKTGLLVNDILSTSVLYKTLQIESENNYVLPNWTKPIFPAKLKAISVIAYGMLTYTPDLARLDAGPLINKIAEQFEDQNSAKLMVYSGHDFTVSSVLNALHLFDYQSPPYAASIIFELHRIGENNFVNIIYKNGPNLQKMVLKNCAFDCPLYEFLDVIRPIRITRSQWDEECDIPHDEYLETEEQYSNKLFLIIICIINGLVMGFGCSLILFYSLKLFEYKLY